MEDKENVLDYNQFIEDLLKCEEPLSENAREHLTVYHGAENKHTNTIGERQENALVQIELNLQMDPDLEKERACVYIEETCEKPDERSDPMRKFLEKNFSPKLLTPPDFLDHATGTPGTHL